MECAEAMCIRAIVVAINKAQKWAFMMEEKVGQRSLMEMGSLLALVMGSD